MLCYSRTPNPEEKNKGFPKFVTNYKHLSRQMLQAENNTSFTVKGELVSVFGNMIIE